ncbi:LuxR C-terminal-related transcriptional regulator [Paucibacter sp. O1-1]|nr:LuxR C-terminal-related transcriptional regulator [Paucibacter sp. O1-1]MDA3829584.1 LuxR C-terminal-related transcriptional regulator [Paucibacter sp. O1-1]
MNNPDPSDILMSQESLKAEALMRAADSALEVRRRYQFFVWMQSHLQPLLPHQLAICGAYQRAARELVFDVFNTVPLPEPLLTELTRSGSALMQRLQLMWLQARGRPVCTSVDAEGGATPDALALVEAGVGDVLLHGLSRPQRPSEIEGFYVFARVGAPATPAQCRHLELLLPHIHATWQRVQNVEHDLSPLPSSMMTPRSSHPTGITERERQILSWLREGKNNQQIGEGLGISALTVKNHVQKILRKLNASNRAQAVACAMTLNLLDHRPPQGFPMLEPANHSPKGL